MSTNDLSPAPLHAGPLVALLATALACGKTVSPPAAPPATEAPPCILELAQPLVAGSHAPRQLTAQGHHCYRLDLSPGAYFRATVTQDEDFDLVWVLSTADGQQSLPFDAVADGIEPLLGYRPPAKADDEAHAAQPLLLDLHEIDAKDGEYELRVEIDPAPTSLLIKLALAARDFAEADREYGHTHEERWLTRMEDSVHQFAATGDPETEAALLYRLADLLQNSIPERLPELAERLIQLQDQYGTDRRRAGSRLMAAMDTDDPRALRWAHRGLEMAQSLHNKKLQALAYQRLGAILWVKAEPGTPEQYYEKASELFLTAGLPLNAAQLQVTLGRWKTFYSDHDGAHRALDQAEKLVQSSNSAAGGKTQYRVRLELLEARGDLAFALERWQEAGKLYAALLGMESSGREGDLHAAALDGLARIEAHLGEGELAELHFAQSIATWEELDQTELANAVRIQRAYERYKRKKLDEAEQDYRELCADGSKAGADLHPLTWASCRFGLGRIARDRVDSPLGQRNRAKGSRPRSSVGLLTLALGRMEEALHQIEEYRAKADRIDQRQHLAARRQHYYEEVIEVALLLDEQTGSTNHYLEYAFAVSERAHGRTLRDLLRARNNTPSREAPAATQWLTLQETKALAAEKRVLILQYDIGPHQSHLWAIGEGVAEVFTLPRRSELESSLSQYWKAIRDSHRPRKEKASRQAACEASDLLLSPIADLLHDQPLWIIAQTDLDAFPFAALPIPSSGNERSCESTLEDQPTLLVERHRIVRPPSVSSIGWLRSWASRRRPNAGKTLAVVAAPTYGDSSYYKSLSGAQEEADRVSALVPPAARLIFTAEDAKASAILDGRLNGYQYLDFATHAEVGNRQEYASLILSPDTAKGETGEGHLYAYQIARVELSADLVSLAGCATGQGEKLAGESLQGLPQAFFAAGVPRVLVSLWPIEDEPTAAFMVHFFRALLIDQASPAEALQTTQMHFLHHPDHPKWRAPGHWAAFALRGLP